MGIATIDPVVYGKLLAAELPKTIQNEEEFDRMVARLEQLDFPNHALTPEEKALREVLSVLIRDFDDRHYSLPEVPPHEMLQFLMEQNGLKQSGLVEILGSRAQVSDLVNGRRAISKANAKKLAEFFHVSAEVFI